MATLSARQPPSGGGAASGAFGHQPFDRAAILERFPWLAPNDEPALLIIGDDLDAALSAVLFLHTHPRAQLAGVYHEYRRVHHAAGLTWEQLLDGLWLDLDIYHPQVRSLGHHITRLDPGESLPGFVHNCNPNTLAGISRQHFRHKYPLGTIHFLLWLYAVEIPAHPHAEALIWLADSAYINGQTQSFKNGTPRAGFRWNVAEWLQVVLPLPSLLRSFATLDTPEFEQRMAALHRRMAQRGFVQGMGQVASRHLQLAGYQCQPQGAIAPYLRNLLAFIAQHTGWMARPEQLSLLGKELRTREGRRERADLAAVQRVGLRRFLEEQGIFSYVFDFSRRINYTVMSPAAP